MRHPKGCEPDQPWPYKNKKAGTKWVLWNRSSQAFAITRISKAARPSEYWYFHLFAFLATCAGIFTFFFVFVILLALTLPSLAVNVRRLHDIDRSGWFIFIVCIPLAGPIILLIWHCERSTRGDNRFGPDPLPG